MKDKGMKKRILAIILCLVMVAGICGTALAEGLDADNNANAVIETEVSTEGELSEDAVVVDDTTVVEDMETLEQPDSSADVISEDSEIEEETTIEEATAEDSTEAQPEETLTLTQELDGTTITLSGPESSFEEGKEYSLSVSKIENTTEENNEAAIALETIEEAIDKMAEEKEKTVASYQAFDIKLLADGEEVQPLGPVEVKFSGEKVAESVADETIETNVIHVDAETGELEDMEAVTVEADVAIETTHFSIYVYVELADAEAAKEITLTVEHWVQNYVDSEEYIKYDDTDVILHDGFKGTVEGLVSMCLSDEAEVHHDLKNTYIQDENGEWVKVKNNETISLSDDETIKLEYTVDEDSIVQPESFFDTSRVKITNKIEKNKTATALDVNDQTTVTLQVGGDQEQLGVDIIYIVGSYATNSDGTPNPEGDVLIGSLIESIGEIVQTGTPVNFGLVPFSSDTVVAMPLTSITKDNLEELPSLIADALATCEALYDGVNMENALIKCKKMFSESELADHPERQHLVMITSGFTYFFNSGENNEYVSTVPVNYKGVNRLFYWNKAWQRARTNQTNTYPIPKGIVQAHTAAVEAETTSLGLWDFYWSYIDQWTRADIAAGDKVVYEACTIESGNFLKWYNSGELVSGYSQTGYGKAVPKAQTTDEDIANAVTLTAGANPLTDDAAAHAIGYERAMWEAYEYTKANITGAGINFYPIYNALNANYTNGNWSPASYGVNWTNQYIGHSFVDMLAGGEGQAIKYEKQGDKTFFDPIKEQLLYSCSVGSEVEDYIGYDPEKGNFEFIQKADALSLNIGDKEYETTKLETPNEGATSSYVFTALGAEEATFTLDYYYGNGTTTEKFIWTFGENISKYIPVTLTYKLQLTEKSTVSGAHVVDTNISATLYPKNSDGEPGNPEVFPIPEVEYIVKQKIRIVKASSEDSSLLQGAEFSLTCTSNNEYTFENQTTTASGEVGFEILNGTYTLKETKAPEGYSLTDAEYIITLDEEGNFSVKCGDSDYTYDTKDGVIVITIENTPLYELPATGGEGIYMYLIAGVVLLMGGVTIIYKQRCKEVLRRR